jgi:hypothetical protein
MALKGSNMILFRFPENKEEKFDVLKQRIESFFTMRGTDKPKISDRQLEALEELSKYPEVFFFSKTPIFEDPDNEQNFLTCQSFKTDSLENKIRGNKGKVFIFYYCTGEVIQGLFVKSSEWTNINREKGIDSILD